MSDDTRFPADTGFQQEIALVWSISQDFGVLDMSHSGDLGGGMMQEPLTGKRLACVAAESSKHLLIIARPRQRRGQLGFTQRGFISVDHHKLLHPTELGWWDLVQAEPRLTKAVHADH
jgi:hypothetical protein